MRALDLEQEGRTRREIAGLLDVSEAAVSKWLSAARHGGPEALRAHPAPGPASKITAEQLRMVPDLLSHGAEAYGFRGDVWNCERVAGVIYQEFGAWYSTSRVSRLLKQLEWTPQVPISRAIQRDDEAIERWRTESWPAPKERARREHRDLVFVDESGSYLLPARVKTWRRIGPANRDRPPGTDNLDRADRMTPAGCDCYHPLWGCLDGNGAMAWRTIGSQDYYQHTYRDVDGRVRTRYFGRGPVAEAVASLHDTERERLAAIERRTVEYSKGVDELSAAWMRLNGWHRHRGQWRRTGKITRRSMLTPAEMDRLIAAETVRREFEKGSVAELIERYRGDMAANTIPR